MDVVCTSKLQKCSFYMLHALLCVFLCCFSDVSAVAAQSECMAPSEYLTELKRLNFDVDTDYSCLTDLVTLGQKLPSYQIINTQASHIFENTNQIKNSWVIPVSDLRGKEFLHAKSLLLIGGGFSRVNAAHDCALLKKAGFSNVKILVGGMETWVNQQKSENIQKKSIPSITPQEFLFEYFNGQIVLISASKATSSKLIELGITKFYSVDNQDTQKITDIILNKSRNGYDPVVVINDTNQPMADMRARLPNMYQLNGGVNTIRYQIEQNLWANQNRIDMAPRGFCAHK